MVDLATYDFEVDAQGWVAFTNSPSAARSTTSPIAGTASFRAVASTTTAAYAAVRSPFITGVVAGTQVDVSIKYRTDGTKRSCYAYIDFFTDTGYISSTTGAEDKFIDRSNLTAGVPATVAFSAVPPAGATRMRLVVGAVDALSGDVFLVDTGTVSTGATAANTAPTANAGPDVETDVLFPTPLKGSGTDPDGSVASYAWRKASGPAGAFDTPTVPGPKYTPRESGSHVLGLVVKDNQGASSAEDQATVTALHGVPVHVRRNGEIVVGRKYIFRNGGTEAETRIAGAAGLVSAAAFGTGGSAANAPTNILTANQTGSDTALAWAATGTASGTNTTVTRDTAVFRTGPAAVKVVAAAAGNTEITTGWRAVKGVPDGKALTHKIWRNSTGTTPPTLKVLINWIDAAATLISPQVSASFSGTHVADAWVEYTAPTTTPPAGAVEAEFILVHGSMDAAEATYVDDYTCTYQ